MKQQRKAQNEIRKACDLFIETLGVNCSDPRIFTILGEQAEKHSLYAVSRVPAIFKISDKDKLIIENIVMGFAAYIHSVAVCMEVGNKPAIDAAWEEFKQRANRIFSEG